MRISLETVTARTDPLPSNLTDKELLQHMENNFHAAAGPWKEVLKRFRQAIEVQVDTLPNQCECPSCGTVLMLGWSVDSN